MNKKTMITASVLSLLYSQAMAQTSSQNYIVEKKLLDANGTRTITTVTYYDDFGYPDETATNGLSGDGKYTFSRKEYDMPGRVSREWLPGATASNGNYMTGSSLSSAAQAILNDRMPYSKYEYDALGRVVSTTGPGANWHQAQRAVQKRYGFNEANSVKWYTVSSSGELVSKGYYPANALSSEKVTDEDGGYVETFTNLYGKKVLERRNDGNDTYYVYDGLSRLTSSHYAEGSDMSQNKERYSENILSYSPNGSIEKLQRYGKRNNDTFGLIDDLTYSYNGNQVKSITDKAGSLLYDGSFDFKDGANEATEYFYDANGALTKDLNKGISNIEYDVVGNLRCITFSNGNKTKYVYDADGTKLQTTHGSVVTNTTDYAGNFIFEDGKLAKYLFEGGYCSFDTSLQPTYHYYERDHLGSVRMVVNENGTIEQVNHYYPFGGVYGDLSYNSELQRNKYIGKEFDHADGLDWYDHGARMYDAARVAWDRKEPLYDKYYRLNPYLYSGNNPVRFFDKNGLDWYETKNHLFIWNPRVHSQADLQKGYKYIGKTFYDKENDTKYRQDGTVLFSNETLAYKRMEILSRKHWKSKQYPEGKEESAYLLKDGRVLVMADNWNKSDLSKNPGYILKDDKLYNEQNEIFEVVGHVHTHPSKTSDKGFSNRDWNMAVAHPRIPYFIIHGDGYLYGGVNQNGKMRVWENNPMADFTEIKNGTLSLFYLINELKK